MSDHAVRMLAGMLADVQGVWLDALSVKGFDDLRNHILLKTPTVQGIKNQIILEKIGAQPFDREAAILHLAALERDT